MCCAQLCLRLQRLFHLSNSSTSSSERRCSHSATANCLTMRTIALRAASRSELRRQPGALLRSAPAGRRPTRPPPPRSSPLLPHTLRMQIRAQTVFLHFRIVCSDRCDSSSCGSRAARACLIDVSTLDGCELHLL